MALTGDSEGGPLGTRGEGRLGVIRAMRDPHNCTVAGYPAAHPRDGWHFRAENLEVKVRALEEGGECIAFDDWRGGIDPLPHRPVAPIPAPPRARRVRT